MGRAFEQLLQDVRYAVRTLRSTPGFSVVAILTLAIGIGANSTIFSVVHGVLLQSLPFRDAHQLVEVRTAYPNGEFYTLSAPDFMSVHDENRAFDGVVAFAAAARTVLGLGDPREIASAYVSRRYFEVLGATVRQGRTFSEDDHTAGRNRVLVVSDAFWRQELGGAEDVIGRQITVNDAPHTIVGVLAPGAEIPQAARLFTPLAYDSTFSSATAVERRGEYLFVIARLRAGQNFDQATRDMQQLGTRLQQQFPGTNESLTFHTRSLSDSLFGDVRAPLLILLGAVGFVLLVACVNVANLLLARATVRQSELVVRSALGAGRGRLVRQMLTESLVLASFGAGAGLLIAWWGTQYLIQAQPVELPRLGQVGMNGTVVLFTVVITLFTGLLFGVLPSLQATGSQMTRTLREGGRGALAGGRGKRIRSALVIAEMALAVMLLVGAGLLIRSFLNLTHVDPGFETDRAVSVRVSLQGARYNETGTRVQFFNELFSRLESLPGVTHVGGSTGLPLSGESGMVSFAVEGAPPPPAGIFPEIRTVRVTPGYFGAIGGTLLHGRMLEERDALRPVVLVNRATIARWFPDGDAVGDRVIIGPPREVIGVIDDVLQMTPGRAAEPEVYLPYEQSPGRRLRVVVRANGDPMALAPRIRAEIRALDPDLPLEAVTPLQQLVSTSIARPRFYTMLLTIFAGAALTLAVVGIFGVMSYTVAQQKREIGLRMALGADAAELARKVVGSGLRLAAVGLAIGLLAALAVGRVLRNQLFGISLADPLTITLVTAVLLGSAALASYLPARRAARVDPGEALR